MAAVRIGVVGAGAWGSALASHAARLGHDVCLQAREPEVVAEINAHHRNTPFLEGIELPESVRATGDVREAAADAAVVLLVPPAQHLRAVAASLRGALAPDALVLVASKGIEESSLELASQVMAEALPELGPERVAFLSGPTFAREVAAGLPTDVVVASSDRRAAQQLQLLLHAPALRVYTSSDPVGVQVGGAVKNVIAVAAGASDGLGLGTNARASLITRGLAEMARLGVALGGDALTFLGLAGVGDLVLTCTGDLSRNRTLGRALAEGADPRAYLAGRRSVAEGYATAAAAWALAQERGVDMPITEQVYHVLHRGRTLGEAIQRLLTRAQKDELAGIRDDPA